MSNANLKLLIEEPDENEFIQSRRAHLDLIAHDPELLEQYKKYASYNPESNGSFPEYFATIGNSSIERINNLRIIAMLHAIEKMNADCSQKQQNAFNNAHLELDKTFRKNRQTLHAVYWSSFYMNDRANTELHENVSPDDFIDSIKSRLPNNEFKDEFVENHLRQLYGEQRFDGLIAFKDGKYPNKASLSEEEIKKRNNFIVTPLFGLTTEMRMPITSEFSPNINSVSANYFTSIQKFIDLDKSWNEIEHAKEIYITNREKIINPLLQPLPQRSPLRIESFNEDKFEEVSVVDIIPQKQEPKQKSNSGFKSFVRKTKHAAIFIIGLAAATLFGAKSLNKTEAIHSNKFKAKTYVATKPAEQSLTQVKTATTTYEAAKIKKPTHGTKTVKKPAIQPTDDFVQTPPRIVRDTIPVLTLSPVSITIADITTKPDTAVVKEMMKMFEKNIPDSTGTNNFKYHYQPK